MNSHKFLNVILIVVIFFLQACAPATIKTESIPALTEKSQIIVIYFAASDCRFCTKWEENNKGFFASDESKFIDFRTIRRAYFLEPVYKDDLPDDLKWVLEKTKIGGTAPTFIVIVDRNILLQTHKWDREVLPLIKELVTMKKDSLKKVNE